MANLQGITGTFSDSFNTLNDAIQKAYEVGAPYTNAVITIMLSPGFDFFTI